MKMFKNLFYICILESILCACGGEKKYKDNNVLERIENDCLAQIITPYELSLYKGTGKITIPEALQGVCEDDNPIVILYHLK